MYPKKLLICVTCFFSEDRLQYLKKTSDHFSELANEVFVCVITNTRNESDLEKINAVLSSKGFDFDIFQPHGLGHPYLLPWSHFEIVLNKISDQSFTHFMYVEDDILVTRTNIEYWIHGRETLRDSGVYPSFIRVEQKNGEDNWYSSDANFISYAIHLPKVTVLDSSYFYLNLPHPYQGMYFYDRELMLEYLTSEAFTPDSGSTWNIREKATQGLTFLNPPIGFLSRNVVGYDAKSKRIDPGALIHHLPNNYANWDGVMGGSIKINELIVGDLITP